MLNATFILNKDGRPHSVTNVFRPSVDMKVFIVHAHTATHIYQIGSLASQCCSFRCEVYSWMLGIYVLATPEVISGQASTVCNPGDVLVLPTGKSKHCTMARYCTQ